MEKEQIDSTSPAVVETTANSNQSLIKTTDVDNLNLLDPEQMMLFKAYVTNLMRSTKSGIKSVEDAILIYGTAREYGFPFLTSVQHIHTINGKTGLDVHLIRALLLRAGVVYEKTLDYAPQYEYTDGSNVYTDLPVGTTKVANIEAARLLLEKDPTTHPVWICKYYTLGGNNTIRETDLTANHKICLNVVEAQTVAKEGKFTPVMRLNSNPIDFITQWTFTRSVATPNGFKTMTAIGRFSLKEAVTAGLTSSNTYEKYARTMISHRAFTYGAREIASDLLMGCYETNELRAVNDMPYIDVEEVQ